MNRNVVLLSITSFLNDLSSELIFSLLPLLVKEMGGEGLAIGLLSGLRELISNLIKPLSGAISDAFKRRKTLVFIGYTASSIFKLLIALSNSVSQLILFSSLERIGKGIRTAPRDALLSFGREKGKSFGIHRSADTIGALLGVLLALTLLKSGFPLKKAVLFGALISFLSLIPILFVKEDQREETKRNRDREVPSSVEYKPLLIIFSLFSLGAVSPMFLIYQTDVLSSSETAISLYLILNITYLLTSYPSGALSEKVGRERIISVGYLLIGLSLIILSTDSERLMVGSFILYGAGLGITDVVQRALIGDLFHREKRGTGYGIFQGAMGLSSLLGNLLFGYLLDTLGSKSFFLSSTLCILSSGLILRIKQRI